MSANGDTPQTWGEGRGPNLKLITRVVIAIAAVILIIVFLSIAKDIYTDWLWFGSLDFLGIFKKILGMRIWLFFAGTLIAAGYLSVNLYVAYRFSRGDSVLPVPAEVLRLARIAIIAVVVLTVIIMSLVFGSVAQGRWETFLLYFNRVPFGIDDPQFNKDVSFHVATMPMLHFIQGWVMGLVIASLAAAIALYLAVFAFRGVSFNITPRIRGHIAILGALLMLTIAAAHYLDIFELLFSDRGAAPGAGYTDVKARIPVLWILVAISMVSALGFVTSLFYGGSRLMVASFSVWAVLAILAGAVYPMGFQRFRVNPNEFTKEGAYIQRNLEFTRAAYNLENVDESVFPYTPNLSHADVSENPETIKNIRLWDTVPLTATYNQIQFFELFYNFVGVDIDRYNIDGEYRQVMLAPRELSPEDLPEEAQRWVNRKLEFTHGYGVAMSPVTTYTQDGKPEFIMQDIPPEGPIDLDVPQVYYGENTMDFVIVNSKTQEFDFPGPDGGAPIRTFYQGAGGVDIGSFIRKVAYAWRFLDLNVLISGEITSESKVMYRRNIQERVEAVTPFLRLDSDPYLVVADGKLWWIQDAYTTTDRYPYSANTAGEFNYIRNSVKVVVDAYNGAIRFYIVDPEDPIVRMYQKAFPDLFEPITEPDPFQAVPEGLRSHVRYPFDLFTIQARQYLQYHMREPEDFFNKSDQWDFGNELFFEQIQKVRPYYVIMKLPGEQREEFVLIMPFTPFDKPNMVAWMAARNDFPHYGELQTFLFPTGSEDISGTEQVEARITNDDVIRERLTLLCPQEVVQCIRGNLLVIPIGDSILYVEPLFIRPTATDFPLLRQVFVADANNVVMASTLDDGLCVLLNGLEACEDGAVVTRPPDEETSREPPTTGQPSGPAVTPVPGMTGVQQELSRVEDTVEELRESLETLEEALRKLNEALGGDSQ